MRLFFSVAVAVFTIACTAAEQVQPGNPATNQEQSAPNEALTPSLDGWGAPDRREWTAGELLAALAAETWAGSPAAGRLAPILTRQPVSWVWQRNGDDGFEQRQLLLAQVEPGEQTPQVLADIVALLSAPHEGFVDRQVAPAAVEGWSHAERVTLQQRDGGQLAEWLWAHEQDVWAVASGVGLSLGGDLELLLHQASPNQ